MTFQQLLESEGYRTCSFSIRGMYGETCLGVRVDSEKPTEPGDVSFVVDDPRYWLN